MTALLPCPFCGADDADYMPDRLMAPGAEPPVFCNGCHASAMDADSWNRRAPSPAVVGLVEAGVEAAAQAIYSGMFGPHTKWEDDTARQHDRIRKIARSALAAYRKEIGG